MPSKSIGSDINQIFKVHRLISSRKDQKYYSLIGIFLLNDIKVYRDKSQ
jgi:hypothetical protein